MPALLGRAPGLVAYVVVVAAAAIVDSFRGLRAKIYVAAPPGV